MIKGVQEGKSAKGWLVVPITFVAALLLNSFPYPAWMGWVRPDWVTLVLCYWCLALPFWVGVGTGWGVGLLMDVMQFTLFGQHALGKAVIALFLASSYSKVRHYSLAQQCALVMVLSAIDIGIVVWIQHIVTGLEVRWQYWAGAVTAGLLWPVLYPLLRRLRYRSDIARRH